MSTPQLETRPLRIGILGAARIADDGIVTPARILGHELAGVAARDRSRAEAFAAARRITQVYDSYADLVADPEIDVVYNALINSEHTRWNIAALEAGRHVLSEKPMSVTAKEARLVERAAATAQGQIVEGFHYLHHPVNMALRDLVHSGWLGEVQRVELVLTTQAPPTTDPRWSAELLGGATMDLGCYVLNAARQVARWLGQPVHATSAQATFRSPGVDSAAQAELTIGDAISCSATWDMDAPQRVMTWTVIASNGRATSPAFAVPHQDNRLIVESRGTTSEQTYGDQTSYTYQLANLARTLNTGEPFIVDLADAIANAELIDKVRDQAGLATPG